jgi:hypothetical protein
MAQMLRRGGVGPPLASSARRQEYVYVHVRDG